MSSELVYLVEPMALEDIDQVIEIEEKIFSVPWSARAYRFELTENEHSIMLVVRKRPGPVFGLRPGPPRPPVLGYGGFWLLVDEAHIATIGVDPKHQGQGLGGLVLQALLDQAQAQHAHRATLEVRISNVRARTLYEEYGFETLAVRKRYYADNDEDAYIMGTPPFGTPAFQVRLAARRAALYARLAQAESET